jgi:NAD(P)-dependent dehydrogenase (short-subunit alcohol dehydrogenase family)
MDTQTILITGATSGLGLDVVRQLARFPHVRMIAGVRDLQQADRLRAVVPAGRSILFSLDLSSLDSVRRFCSDAIDYLGTDRLSAIALNAGIQITTGLEKSIDGCELTFASNHLGHFLLVHSLLPVLSPHATVVATASGTHDPQDLISRLFGFRGGIFPDAESVAQGRLDPSVSSRQQCLDRYATSKLCNLLFTYDLAQRIPSDRCRFLAFDPGLMPGTKLARDRHFMEQFAWRYLLPPLRFFVPGISSTQQSARTLVNLLTNPSIGSTGTHFNYRGQPTKTSLNSYSQPDRERLYRLSCQLTGIRAEDS